MATSQKLNIFYIFGFFLLFNLIRSEELIQERAGSSVYPLHFKTYIKSYFPDNNFTGFRSAFQWTIGKEIDNYGIHNAMEFNVKDLATQNTTFRGQIGIVSFGSEISIHLSFDSVASAVPGPSFNCSNNFLFYRDIHACYNYKYSLISSAIYFLDVEIRGKTVRGYISHPQRDFTDMDDPYLPRHLIGELQSPKELTNLMPDNYWIANKCVSPMS